MFKKFSIKPAWVGGFALLVAMGVVVKVAIALAFFAPADQPIGYVAQDEMTNYNLRSGTEILYRGQYERERWSGGLLAYPVSAQGDVDIAGRRWDAGEQITLQALNAQRYIATMRDDGVPAGFQLGNLSAAQRTALDNNNAALVSYLRGARTGEGSTFRLRSSVLGDIVHSRPYYVADTSFPTVFVGANDGMLHAINASPGTGGGDERWAYIPSMLIPKLKNLASTVTPFVHDYYVDGQINIAGITTGGNKRILVGGLGAGGKGLYALNITASAGLTASSDADVASKVMWEITPTKLSYANPTVPNAYVNLGYTYGTVTIAKVGGVDAVIVGNGYNDGLAADAYAGCTDTSPSYTNCGGDYAAYLYVINAATGQLISAIKAGPSGTAASPNGLSTPAAIDTDGNGSVDRVYAGDLNGTMWRFDLAATTSCASPPCAAALLTTSPAQAITMTPGVAIHPDGGYMVNFATGKMLVAADATDTAVHYAYGIWDGAPAANGELLSQTLEERSFAAPGGTVRVRRLTTTNQPVWTSGALNHKGWKVALPAGERVLGEGSFIENGRFYFTSHDPTKTSPVIAGTSTTVQGENWLMELDFLTGGAKNDPFLDLSADIILNNNDRIKYTASDTLPSTDPPTEVGDPIMTAAGIPVGKFISTGVLSQPILVQNLSLNDTLFNQNPDVTIPAVELGHGVDGGHFDQDIYYGNGGGAGGAQATATITVVGNGTNPFPATLGAITVSGVTVVPPLTVADLPRGSNTPPNNNANAETIRSKVTGGFTATRNNNVITIRAPLGADYNGMVLSIADGTTQALVPAVAAAPAVPAAAAVSAVRPTGFITFSGTGSTGNYRINDDLSGSSIRVDGNTAEGDAITIGSGRTPVQAADAVVAAIGTGGTYKAYKGGNAITPLCAGVANPTRTVCIVDTSTNNNGSNNNKVITVGSENNGAGLSYAMTNTAGGVTATAATAAVPAVTAVPQSGWTNFKGALTTTTFSGGLDATVVGDPCFRFFGISICTAKNHIHQYDDLYDVTGINMLNASSAKQNLANAIPSTSTKFKVLVHNQYLSPAVKLHIGNPGYQFDIDTGYVRVKDYQTSASLDVTALPTYSRSAVATPGALPIGSLAINMPTDALTARDWWGNGDVRVGLHPTIYSCVQNSTFFGDGNTYQPVMPPANGVDGPGVSNAAGARHNGALTVQVIAANTPQDAIEQNVAGRPEYGWRVKSARYSTYVLAEFNTYWHHPNGKCYASSGWTKTPGPDNGSSGSLAKAAGSTDPKVGELGVGAGVVTDVVTTVSGDVTTTVITYSSGLTARIVRTANRTNGVLDGSVTIVTTDTAGSVTTQVIADTAGTVKSGGDERGLQAKTGRISWRELVAP